MLAGASYGIEEYVDSLRVDLHVCCQPVVDCELCRRGSESSRVCSRLESNTRASWCWRYEAIRAPDTRVRNLKESAHAAAQDCRVGPRQSGDARGEVAARERLRRHRFRQPRTARTAAVRGAGGRPRVRRRRPRADQRLRCGAVVPAVSPERAHRYRGARARHALLRSHRRRAHHEDDHRAEQDVARADGAAVRPCTGFRRYRRRRAGRRVREMSFAAAAGRRIAAEPNRPDGLRLQLVARRRRQRVPERLRSDRRRRAQDGVVDGVDRNGVRRRRDAGSVHDIGRPRHDLRNVPRQSRQRRLQVDALSRPHAADELLLPRVADARTQGPRRRNSDQREAAGEQRRGVHPRVVRRDAGRTPRSAANSCARIARSRWRAPNRPRSRGPPPHRWSRSFSWYATARCRSRVSSSRKRFRSIGS